MILRHGLWTKRPRFVRQKDNFLSCDGYFDTLMVYVYRNDFVRCRNIKNGCMDAIYVYTYIIEAITVLKKASLL